jgi:hypothetical protein
VVMSKVALETLPSSLLPNLASRRGHRLHSCYQETRRAKTTKDYGHSRRRNSLFGGEVIRGF